MRTDKVLHKETGSTQATQMKCLLIDWNDSLWNLILYIDLKDWLQMSLAPFPQAPHTTMWNANLFANTPKQG